MNSRTTHAMSNDRRYFVSLDPANTEAPSLWSAYQWGWVEDMGAFALSWVWAINDNGESAEEVLNMLIAWATEGAITL